MSNPQGSKGPARRSAVPARGSQKRRQAKARTIRRGPRRPRTPLIAGAVAVIIAAIVAIVVATSGSSGQQLAGPAGPEGVPLEQGHLLAAAAAVPPAKGAAIGVGCGATEQLATHIHSHLAVFVNGALRPLPAGVGMVGQLQTQSSPQGTFVNGSSVCLYWLHTHAQDGIIHVEAPAGRTYVLGQFFIVWGQPLTQNRVGPATGTVTAYVNGHLWTQGVDNIPLASHEDIQLDVGTPVVAPRSINFPSSL